MKSSYSFSSSFAMIYCLQKLDLEAAVNFDFVIQLRLSVQHRLHSQIDLQHSQLSLTKVDRLSTFSSSGWSESMQFLGFVHLSTPGMMNWC